MPFAGWLRPFSALPERTPATCRRPGPGRWQLPTDDPLSLQLRDWSPAPVPQPPTATPCRAAGLRQMSRATLPITAAAAAPPDTSDQTQLPLTYLLEELPLVLRDDGHTTELACVRSTPIYPANLVNPSNQVNVVSGCGWAACDAVRLSRSQSAVTCGPLLQTALGHYRYIDSDPTAIMTVDQALRCHRISGKKWMGMVSAI